MGHTPDPPHGAAPPPSGLGISTQEATNITPPGAIKDHITEVGSSWGDLRLLEELGRGAFGRVFRAWDRALAREVALKILRLENADPETLSAVLREGQMLARVRHRNVVTVYGAQQIGREVGVWMELVRGRTLSQMVREDGPMGPEEATVVGMTLCDALAAVHAAGLLHRDIKAQNVMREAGGRLVLMDFGAGLEVIDRQRQGELVGTPLYMSPDVLAGAAWSPAADVYSVGVLLFYLVTGRFPVEGQTLMEIATAHALGEQRALSDLRPEVPEGFARVLRRALANRYRSAGGMLRDLADAIPGHGAGDIGLATEVSPHTPSAQTPLTPLASPSPSAGRALERTAYAAAALGGIGLAGFLTTAAFDNSLRRIPEFTQEGPMDAFVWGLRSLIGPVTYMLLAFVAARLLRALWRAAVRVIPPVTRATLAARRQWRSLVRRAGLTDRQRIAQLLIVAQIVVVAITFWVFYDFIYAFMSFLDVAPASHLDALSPENRMPVLYRTVLPVIVLAMALAWRAVLSRPDVALDRATVAAGLGIVALTLVMTIVPFRLVHHAIFEAAAFDGQRCYVLGARERPPDVQLFCPALMPRIRVVPEADVKRLGIRETVFQR